MSDDVLSPAERIPRKYVYSAHAVMDRIGIFKNRFGRKSKLQSTLGRMKPHLEDDQVVLIISARDLRLIEDRLERKGFLQGIEKRELTRRKIPNLSSPTLDEEEIQETDKQDEVSPIDVYARKQVGMAYANAYGRVHAKKFLDSIKK